MKVNYDRTLFKKLDEYICQWIRGLDNIIPRLVEKMETSTKR